MFHWNQATMKLSSSSNVPVPKVLTRSYGFASRQQDRDLFARAVSGADWSDASSRTARFRIDGAGLKVEFRIEVIRFVAGELCFTGLAYRNI